VIPAVGAGGISRAPCDVQVHTAIGQYPKPQAHAHKSEKSPVPVPAVHAGGENGETGGMYSVVGVVTQTVLSEKEQNPYVFRLAIWYYLLAILMEIKPTCSQAKAQRPSNSIIPFFEYPVGPVVSPIVGTFPIAEHVHAVDGQYLRFVSFDAKFYSFNCLHSLP